ncbi:hypothetical protein FE782_10180 [Paenibacillus antri]|uniref:Spore coat protein n=1 Tax=Paenibacillus antri TaxID=2582848 RepID=A0A5R9GHR7_9BACL|nr:hypothetical protein [Paenibacillus antri]TLS52333.1 hypothetical protein FE782_10180 [Paenibacillus antri]
MQQGYALHETLEVHELAASRTVGLTKSKTMKALVSDDALKQLMQADVELSTRHLEELRDILKKAKR